MDGITFSKAVLAPGNLVLIAHAQMPLVNAYADLSNGPRGLIFGVCHHLHPFLVYASHEGVEVRNLIFGLL